MEYQRSFFFIFGQFVLFRTLRHFAETAAENNTVSDRLLPDPPSAGTIAIAALCQIARLPLPHPVSLSLC